MASIGVNVCLAGWLADPTHMPASHLERADDSTRVYAAVMREVLTESSALQIVFEDNHLLVVEKPSGLLTQAAKAGDDCLLERARDYVRDRYDKPGNVYMGLVHRLDRNVSGLVVLCKTSKAASRLSKAFAKRSIEKRYLAWVVGEPAEAAELVDYLAPRAGRRGVERHPEGKEARLRYRCLERGPRHAALEVELLTGRKHQIRAQLAFNGLAIVGDPLYGVALGHLRRPALHAHRLAFAHPVGKAPMDFSSPAPAALLKAAERLGLRSGWAQF